MILFGKLVRSLKTKHLKRRKKENFVTPIELERNEKYEKKRKKNTGKFARVEAFEYSHGWAQSKITAFSVG